MAFSVLALAVAALPLALGGAFLRGLAFHTLLLGRGLALAGKLLQQVPQLAHGHRLGLFGGERPIQGGDLRIDPVLPQGQARRLGGLPLLPVRGLAGHVLPGGVLLHLAQDRLALGGILSRHRHRGFLRPI